MSCQFIRIESGQIGCRSSSTNDNHGIPVIYFLIDLLQSTDNGLFHLVSLHDSRQQTDIKDKAPCIMEQLIAEVPITGSRCRRNNGNPLRQIRKIQFLIQRQHSFVLQTLQNLPTTTGHVSQSISRINIHYSQRIAVKFMKINRNLHQHFDSGDKRLTGFTLKIRPQPHIDITPDNPSGLRQKRIALRVLLHKLQITVS